MLEDSKKTWFKEKRYSFCGSDKRHFIQ